MALREDVDVLPVRVGEIDREPGPDGADDQSRVRARSRLSSESERQEAKKQHPTHVPRVGADTRSVN
jgi:hypothetical protein